MECSSSTLFVIQRIWLSLCIRTCDSLRVQVTRLAMGLLCQHAKGNQVVFKGQGLGWEFEGKSGNEGSEDNGHELEAIFKEDFLGGKFQILPRQRPCQAYSLRFPTAMGSLTWAACTRDLRFIVLTEKIRLRLPYPRSQRVAFTTIRDTSETLETRQTSFLSEKNIFASTWDRTQISHTASQTPYLVSFPSPHLGPQRDKLSVRNRHNKHEVGDMKFKQKILTESLK